MKDPVEQLGRDVLAMLLKGDDPVLDVLRTQMQRAEVHSSEVSSAGFYVHIDVPIDAPRLPSKPSFSFGDVSAELNELQRGAGFVLYVDEGVLSLLEGYSYDEPWPREVSACKLAYTSGGERALAALRKSPGWPGRC